jgi:hypothetical protein
MNSINQRVKLFGNIQASLLALLVAALPLWAAPPVVAPVAPALQVSHSVFNLPATSKEGRDPFFPTSSRPYATAVVPGGANTSTDLSSLVMQGILGVPPHRLVIINNVTLGVGDEVEVRTSQGRIRFRCIEINGNSVVIEVNGLEHTLHYGDKP